MSSSDDFLKLAVIIPTKGRYKELQTLLNNIASQTLKPDLLVIVDANKQILKDELIKNLAPIKYIHTGPNSLTEARNIGIKNVPEDFGFIGFLDDDVVLEKNAIKLMMEFWHKADRDIGGAAFNIISGKEPRKLWVLKRFFFMADNKPGNILASGYQTMLDKINKNIYTKWLPGGVTVWRKNIFREFKFDEDIKGYGYIEDVDFSYRVSKKYKLICLAEAKLMHTPHSVAGDNNVNFGFFEITNRFYFIKKHKEFSKMLFCWASFGMILENITRGVLTFNRGYFKRSLGNILGIKKIYNL